MGSLKNILGTFPVLLFGLGDLNVVAFGAEQDKVEAPQNATDIPALKQLQLLGKVVFLKSEGDLVMGEFSKVKQCLNEELGEAEEEEEADKDAREEDGEDAMAVDEEDGVAKEQDEDSAVDSDDMEDAESGPGENSEEEDESGEDEEESDDEAAKEALKLSVFQSILAQTGPKVKAVVINASGKVVEKEIDMTPKVDIVSKVLGGPATIVGQYQNGAVVMKLKDPKESMDHNEATLPAPFDKEPIQGKILLVRMDENSEPQDFTAEDYEDLCENGDGPVEKEKLDLDAKDCQSIKEIARSIGSAHGAKIVEFYEKEIAAIQNESELKRIALAIGQVHGKRIAEFLDKDEGSSEENETAVLVDDLEEGDDEEDKDFDPKDVESVVSEADGDSDEASTDDEKDATSATDVNKKFAAVLVKTDGSAEEHTIDISQISKLIGGSPTIVADYENGIVITKLFNPKPSQDKLNMAQLPAPYDTIQILGNFVVMKYDKSGAPIDFTLKDYGSFAVESDDKEDEDYKDDDEEGDEDEEEEEEEEDSESESDEDAEIEEEEVEAEGSGGEMLRELFAMSGPVITAVHVLADGTLKDIEMDMSPKLDTPGKVLGGSLSIVGQYENGVVVLTRREPSSNATVNPAKLPSPFNKEQIKGSFLLIKMDEASEPQSFSVADFERQKRLPSEHDQTKLAQISSDKEAKCVIVRENGEIYDETMSLAEVKNVVGGEISCAGQYDDLSAVLKLKFPRPSTAKENAVVLPHPFHEESVLGCYAVVKLDKKLCDVTSGSISLVDYSIEDFAKLRSDREKFESLEDADYEANSDEDAESSEDESDEEKNAQEDKARKEQQQRAVVRKIIDKEYGELPEKKKEKLVTDLIASYNGDQKFRAANTSQTPSAKSATKQRKKRKSDVFHASGHKKIRTDEEAIPEEHVMRTKSPGGSLRIQPAN